MLKKHIDKENLPCFSKIDTPRYQQTFINFNILRPFLSIYLESDPISIPSFNFIDPDICRQPYLTETTILDKVLPTFNPLIDQKNKEKENKRIKANKSPIMKKKMVVSQEVSDSPAKKTPKNVRFKESPQVVVNGVRVSINKQNLFDDCDCKQSNFIDSPLKKTPKMAKLADFEIGKTLGKGRFGTVFLVRHRETGTLYALKMVNKEKAKEENVYHLIQREALIQESIDHPNILKCYGSFEDETRFYLVLEYVLDGDLYHTLRQQPEKRFSEEKASQIIMQLLNALVYLKHRSILHRDIKGENIMNSMVYKLPHLIFNVFKGVFKLCDFGWAIVNKDNETRKTFCGTVEYVAPEMIMNESYTESIDVWAVAVLAFELVSGEPPFYCCESIDTFSKILSVDFIMPEYFSKELKDFVERILVKDVKKRMSLYETIEHPFIKKHNNVRTEDFQSLGNTLF